MELLKARILKEGKALDGNIIKVDSFLNHQIDTVLLDEIGKEFYALFQSSNITKVLTIESSGIAIGVFVAKYLGVPLVFAKKTMSLNLDENVYTSIVHSYTKNKLYDIKVSKNYLSENDNVLIVDDFLANGQAALGLSNIVKEAGAKLEGIGIVIEKGFQGGGKLLRDMGIRVESLATISQMNNGEIIF